ncbi:efflux RND transporter periplasmic adaptor subunit [Aurantimonas endophytica]|uniref:RND family efflux transporter MFP subunit n=1 Tax=Aurantimonas endophytica TaxID=1522175 RepID=A0A7W6HC56_9HYPH|nr:efflux RND transporter periplasmic adaptor subunit [Aurantimonas endophytica]MBB4002469.1 RND family efflux transporter MFP subunit [Aurantimonas endophytica]MCO6401910.1 efflux RND transporter periplasmic adaptor subunit [Aurantimonas endophytica]
MAILKQVLVTFLVLIVAAAAYIKWDPSAGRAVLDSEMAPGFVRTAILFVAPEAGEPPAATAEGTVGNPRRGSGGATIVVADTVATGVTRTAMRSIGTGEAARSVVVYPDNTTGIIEEVQVQSGDRVEAGSILARLERANEEVAVARAQLGVEAAEDKLRRFQRLQNSNTITAVEVTDVARERDNARLDLQAAEIALGKRDIRAPIAGRVGIVSADQGDLVGNDTVIATIDDRSQLKVVFFTPESFVQDLEIGAPLQAVSTARPNRIHEGRIVAIDSRLDEASRTLRTEAMIENTEDQLRPGMSFSVSLELDGETFLSVDPLAVVWERNGPIVWKIVDEKAAKAPVRIVERNIDRILVASDTLKEGDLVVVEGLQTVREGGPVEIQRVRPVPAAAEETSPAEGVALETPLGEESATPAPAPLDRAAAAQLPGPGTGPSGSARTTTR